MGCCRIESDQRMNLGVSMSITGGRRGYDCFFKMTLAQQRHVHDRCTVRPPDAYSITGLDIDLPVMISRPVCKPWEHVWQTEQCIGEQRMNSWWRSKSTTYIPLDRHMRQSAQICLAPCNAPSADRERYPQRPVHALLRSPPLEPHLVGYPVSSKFVTRGSR